VKVVQAGGQKRLAAYLVDDGDRLPGAHQLRSRLQSRLPEHMVPASFVRLPALPLNANGKVDRSALPDPEALQVPKSPTDAVKGDLEEIIIQIWRKVLSHPHIGPDDNFFDLGGDSLGLVQAHAELQQSLQRTISITELFEFPSVRALRQHLSGEVARPAAFSELQQRAKRQRAALARPRAVGTVGK